MADIDEQYKMERDLNNAKSNDANKTSIVDVAADIAVSQAKSMAKDAIKKSLWQAIGPILPYIAIGIGVIIGIIIVVAVVIDIGCGIIPGSAMFSTMCRDAQFSSDEVQDLKQTSGINDAANSFCSDNGGSYDSYGNNCSYGY